jgi:uncharacterized protein YceK
MHKLILRCFIFLTTAVLLSGCASILSKSDYPVSLTTEPPGSVVTVQDRGGKVVFKGVTPTSVVLAAGAGYFKGQDYRVVFELDGYARKEVSIRRELDAWYIGNVIFGGLIGMLIVDPLTGAMWKLDREVHAVLAPGLAGVPEGPALLMVTLDQIPEGMLQHMVAVR